MRRPIGIGQAELLRERLVDDGHLRRADGVGVGELAPGQDRHLHHVEVARPDFIPPRAGVGVWPRVEALRPHAGAPAVAGEDRDARGRDAVDAGHAGEAVFQFGQQGARALGRIAVQRGRDPERHDVLGGDAQRHAAHVHQAFHEQAGRHEQGHRQRDLGRREEPPEARGRARAGRLARLRLDRGDEIRPRALPRREQAEEESRAEGDDRGEDEHPPVHGELDRARGFGGENGANALKRPARHHEARGAAGQGQQAGFEQELPHELPAARADGEPHGDFGLPGGRAGEEQVGHVGARDEQHERGDAEQQRERRDGLRVDLALAVRTGRDEDRLCAEALHRLIAHPGLEAGLDVVEDRVVRHVDRRARLLERRARLQPREEIGPVGAPVLEPARRAVQRVAQRDRDIREGARPERHAVEARRRHADDRQRLAVDGERLADDTRIAGEVRLPVGVADHGDGRLARRAVVGRPEEPSERRVEAEHREVAAGDELRLAVDRLAVDREVRAEGAVQRDGREHRLLALEIAEHRVAEHLIAVARLVARRGARLGSGGSQVHEAGRGVHRHRPEQQLVEDREDCRVRADPECQGGHGHGGDERRAGETPEGELQGEHGKEVDECRVEMVYSGRWPAM